MPMFRVLYLVGVEIDAEDEDEAQELAQYQIRETLRHRRANVNSAVYSSTTPLRYIP